MIKNQQLEQYLAELEQALTKTLPSKRSQIVQETNQQVLQQQKSFPHKELSSILAELGSPQSLANHHLLQEGLETVKINKRPSLLKWFFLAMLTGLGLMLLSIGLLIWKFTPLFKVDENTQRVTVLGGLIDVNGISGRIKIGNTYQFLPNKFSNQFNGSFEAPSLEYDEVVINFKSGILNIRPSLSPTLGWDCKLEKAPSEEFVNINQDTIELDLEKTGGASCTIELPQDLKITVDGREGQVNIIEPQNDFFLEMDHGQVNLTLDPEREYRYQLNVDDGQILDLPTSSENDGTELRINLKTGIIRRNRI